MKLCQNDNSFAFGDVCKLLSRISVVMASSGGQPSSASMESKRSPPPFYIEGILRDSKEKKDDSQQGSFQAQLTPISPATMPPRLHVSSPISSYMARPFSGKPAQLKAIS